MPSKAYMSWPDSEGMHCVRMQQHGMEARTYPVSLQQWQVNEGIPVRDDRWQSSLGLHMPRKSSVEAEPGPVLE